MKADQERVRSLLADTVVMLCKSGISFERHLTVQGLLGVTVDDGEVFVVHIDRHLGADGGISANTLNKTNCNDRGEDSGHLASRPGNPGDSKNVVENDGMVFNAGVRERDQNNRILFNAGVRERDQNDRIVFDAGVKERDQGGMSSGRDLDVKFTLCSTGARNEREDWGIFERLQHRPFEDEQSCVRTPWQPRGYVESRNTRTSEMDLQRQAGGEGYSSGGEKIARYSEGNYRDMMEYRMREQCSERFVRSRELDRRRVGDVGYGEDGFGLGRPVQRFGMRHSEGGILLSDHGITNINFPRSKGISMNGAVSISSCDDRARRVSDSLDAIPDLDRARLCLKDRALADFNCIQNTTQFDENQNGFPRISTIKQPQTDRNINGGNNIENSIVCDIDEASHVQLIANEDDFDDINLGDILDTDETADNSQALQNLCAIDLIENDTNESASAMCFQEIQEDVVGIANTVRDDQQGCDEGFKLVDSLKKSSGCSSSQGGVSFVPCARQVSRPRKRRQSCSVVTPVRPGKTSTPPLRRAYVSLVSCGVDPQSIVKCDEVKVDSSLPPSSLCKSRKKSGEVVSVVITNGEVETSPAVVTKESGAVHIVSTSQGGSTLSNTKPNITDSVSDDLKSNFRDSNSDDLKSGSKDSASESLKPSRRDSAVENLKSGSQIPQLVAKLKIKKKNSCDNQKTEWEAEESSSTPAGVGGVKRSAGDEMPKPRGESRCHLCGGVYPHLRSLLLHYNRFHRVLASEVTNGSRGARKNGRDKGDVSQKSKDLVKMSEGCQGSNDSSTDKRLGTGRSRVGGQTHQSIRISLSRKSKVKVAA